MKKSFTILVSLIILWPLSVAVEIVWAAHYLDSIEKTSWTTLISLIGLSFIWVLLTQQSLKEAPPDDVGQHDREDAEDT